MTREEKQKVIDWLDEYPSGIPTDCWGCSSHFENSADVEYIDNDVCREHG